ncbi:catalase family peroxidase [Alkalimonas mucilaginosa]|uniref:Catalase-related peroxidase n=1 Tax=Alkalimonas mucilaginosa TaxID=3057676 RepID=A0ABU7JGJ3_9GAMM|nr:catalase family peroxidase [Alkalimonas sp. MEB004]MEE2024811.1 catalase family peroxidase [Alkalimonas sp. MEB004]
MRYVLFAAAAGAVVAAAVYAVTVSGRAPVSAQDFVNLQQGDSIQAGFRRAHAKGFCISGEFQASGELAAYSSAKALQPGSYPLIGRISIAGSNPTAPDLRAPVRSLALTILPDTVHQWRTAMNTPPVMAVATPEKFYQQLLAIQSNTVPQFFADHPESAHFLQWRSHYQPTQSYATERYHSINAFYLVDRQGKQQAVRWAALPLTDDAGVIADEEAADALQQEFFSRLQQGPVRFDLQFTLATAKDEPADATTPWPESNPQLSAGTIVIEQASVQQEGACNALNFDPLVLPAGFAPSADPILRARAAAYAESHRRRAREVLMQQVAGGANE